MKKILMILFILMIILAGCSTDVSEEKDNGADPEVPITDGDTIKLSVLPEKFFAKFPDSFLNSGRIEENENINAVWKFATGSEESYLIAALTYINADIIFTNEEDSIINNEIKIQVGNEYIKLLNNLLPDFIDGDMYSEQLKNSIIVLYDINISYRNNKQEVEFFTEILGVETSLSNVFSYREHTVTREYNTNKISVEFKIESNINKTFTYSPDNSTFSILEENSSYNYDEIEFMDMAIIAENLSFNYYARMNNDEDKKTIVASGYFDTSGGALQSKSNYFEVSKEDISENSTINYIYNNNGKIQDQTSLPVEPGESDHLGDYSNEILDVSSNLSNILSEYTSIIYFDKATIGEEYYLVDKKIENNNSMTKEIIVGYGFSAQAGVINAEIWNNTNYQPGQLIFVYKIEDDGTFIYVGEVYGPEYY